MLRMDRGGGWGKNKNGALLGGSFNNLEEHCDDGTTDSETWSAPECILKVE